MEKVKHERSRRKLITDSGWGSPFPNKRGEKTVIANTGRFSYIKKLSFVVKTTTKKIDYKANWKFWRKYSLNTLSI